MGPVPHTEELAVSPLPTRLVVKEELHQETVIKVQNLLHDYPIFETIIFACAHHLLT